MLTNIGHKDVQLKKTGYGHILEGFVFGELLKHTTTADNDYRLLYYREA